ncbi:Thioesterase/thiol ester dehydrase-isomerase [Xylariomycetidae sp. FL0641]|nr:Thioesterase/thiol ester dehydrase-isomerase [Xylariomycetidae sp. FL0641]
MALIESFVAVKREGQDVFANAYPLNRSQVAGSVLIGQAMSAASNTVPLDFCAYSCQSAFPRAATPNEALVYNVERIADSRTQATRLVRTTQGEGSSNCVFVATILFQTKSKVNNALVYGTPMPDLDGIRPEDISSDTHNSMMESSVDSATTPFELFRGDQQPFDWRPAAFLGSDDPSEVCIRGFVRSLKPLSTDAPAVHLAALGFLSDQGLLATPIYANPLQTGVQYKNVVKGVTLSHTFSLHDPAARADEWIMGQRTSSWGAEGRVIIHEQCWNLQTGRLVLSSRQEALVRLKDNAKYSKL